MTLSPETRFVLSKTARGCVRAGGLLWRLAAWLVDKGHELDEKADA